MDEFDRYCRQEEKLEQILRAGNPDDRMYVYWSCDGEMIKPAILNNVTPFDDLYQFLRAEYGGQRYYIMIRRGKKMIFTGEIGIAQPLNFTPRKDIRLEIARLRQKERQKIEALASD